MPEDKFSNLYSYLKQNELTDLDEKTFKSKYSDINKSKELHSYLKSEGMTDLDVNSFHNEYFGSVKKKETTPSVSELLTGSFASATDQQVTEKPSVSSGSESDIYTGFPGKEKNEYKYSKDNQGKDAWFVKREGQKDFTVISNEGSINALNKQFKKQVVPSKETQEQRKQELTSKSYSFVTDDLLKKSEEELVPYLRETFNKKGVGDIFDIEEIGAGYDAIKITNRYTGESRDISLQNWTSDRNNSEAKILKSFIQANTYNPELYRKKKQLQELEQNFDNTDYANIVENTKKLNTLKKEVKESEKELNRYVKTSGDLKSASFSKTQLENTKNELASNSFRVIEYKQKVKEYNQYNDEIQRGLNDGTITQEQYLSTWKPQLDKQRQDLEENKETLSIAREEAKKRSEDLNEMMAEYIDVQKDRGNFLTGTARSFVEGYGSVMDFLIAPKGKEGEVKQAFTDAISPGIVTKEYLTNEDRSWFEQAIGGLANSIGASVAAPTVSLAGLYASSYQNMKEQMNTPEFKDVPEYEKIIMSTIYGGVISGLEKFGLDKVFSKSPIGSKITNYLFSLAIKELPKNATKEMIESAIDKSLKNAIAKRIINVSGGMIVEGATEGLQDMAEVGLKYGYNQLKEKDYFETPKTATEFWQGVGKSTLLGMIGAGTMQGVIQSASLLNRGIDANSIQSIDAITKDDTLKEIVVSKVQNDVLAGEKTKEEGKEIIENINNAVSIANKIPENLSDEDKATSFNLIQERSNLEKEIAGKDEALIVPQKERINAINEELKAISVKPKTEQDAVQEQATDESVLRTEQPEMGLREVEQVDTKQEVTTEEGKQEEVIPTETQATEEKVIPKKEDIQVSISGTRRGKEKLFGEKTKKDFDVRDFETDKKFKDGVAIIDNDKDGTQEIIYAINATDDVGRPGYLGFYVTIPKVSDTGEISSKIKEAVNESMEAYGVPKNARLDKVSDEFYKATQENILYKLSTQQPTSKESLQVAPTEQISQTEDDVDSGDVTTESQAETSTEEVDNIESLKESTGKKVVDFLDKISKSIDDQLKEGLNDVTRVVPLKIAKVIVESLKSAVKAGMTLQQALSKVAKENNLTEVDVVNAIEKLQNAKKSTPASKAAEKISKPTKTKVTVNTMSALKDQIRLEAKAAREGAKSATNAIKDTIVAVKDLFSKGILTAKQHKAILNKIRKTNFANPDKIQELIDYAEKVSQRAEYAEQIFNANNTIRSIKKAIKDKNLQDSVRQVAKRFAKIIPSQIPDSKLNEFSELLEKVFDAVKKSRVSGKFENAEMQTKIATELDKVTEFTDKQLELQDEIRKNNLVDLFADIFEGQDTSKMSLSDVLDFIDSFSESESTSEEKQETIRKGLIDKIKGISSIIDYLVTNNKDPFTDDDVEYSNDVVNTIQRAINTDLSDVDNKTLAQIYEALDNFVVNGIVDNLNAIIPTIEANNDLKKQFTEKGQSRQFKTMFGKNILSREISKAYNLLISNMTLFFEKKFPGISNAQNVIAMLGITDIINGHNKAIKKAELITKKYIEQFKDKKPNGQKFFSSFNAAERGIYSDLLRNVIGNEKQQREEFTRKLNLLFQSTNRLLESLNKKEKQTGELYKEVIKKLGLIEEYNNYNGTYINNFNVTIQDIESKVDSINKQAVQFWIDVYSENYDSLAFISQSVYNSVLKPELNYNPTRYKRLENSLEGFKDREDEILSKKGGFYNLTTDIDKSGTLKATTKPRRLKEDSYISYDFDLNNSEILKAALVDIETAVAIRKFAGAKKSKYFKKVMGEDAKAIANRVDAYIKYTKGKGVPSQEWDRLVSKAESKISNYITARVLGGTYATALKQTLPPIINTFFTAGKYTKHVFDLKNLKKTTDWINKTGMPISNRGAEASALVESLDKTIENEMKNQTANTIINVWDKIGNSYLKIFLTNADLFVARGSFLSYYIQDLKRKGIDFSYDAEMNQESLEYAQAMVDRQQQVSEKGLQGQLYQQKGFVGVLTKKILPFSNMTLNLKSRLYSDSIALANWSMLSEQDKNLALKSIIGTFAEITAFNAISIGLYSVLKDLVDDLDDDDDDDKVKNKEDKVKDVNRIKSSLLSRAFVDIVSPAPFLDNSIIALTKFIQESIDKGVDYVSGEKETQGFEKKYKALSKNDKAEFDRILKLSEEEKTSEMTDKQKEKLLDDYIANRDWGLELNYTDEYSSWGMFGAGAKLSIDAYNAINKLYSNEIEVESFGEKKTKYIKQEDKDKKILANVLILGHAIGLLPAEMKSVGNRLNKNIEKRAYTEEQYENIDFLNKNVGNSIMNSKISNETIKREKLSPKMTYLKMFQKKFKIETIIDYMYLDGKISSDKRIELLNKLED